MTICAAAAIAVVVVSCASMSQKTNFALTKDGKPALTIVIPDAPDADQKLAADELKTHLDTAAGCAFEIKKLSEAGDAGNRIFVGRPAEVKALYGKDYAALADQTSVVASEKGDVVLTGQGFGMLYAAHDFLEDSIGVRWFTGYTGGTKIPKVTRFDLKESVKTPSFYSRGQHNFYVFLKEGRRFFLRHRANFHVFDEEYATGHTTIKKSTCPCHTFYTYIKPFTNTVINAFRWPNEEEKNKTYFAEHPEWFSLAGDGKRVATQLCFSNRELRKEIMRRMEIQLKMHKGLGHFNLSAQDRPYSFCECKECKALEKKLGCIGGPLYDCLIEICETFKDKYPEALFSTLSYRKNQTEDPPKVDKLPDNLLVIFAPVDDDVTKTFDHPHNAGTYANLKRWCELVPNVWVWYYMYYGGPCGVTERMLTDIRLMREAGVNGTLFEFNSDDHLGLNFAPLNRYLALRRFCDVNGDSEKDIREFCDHHYGAAADKVIGYLHDLEIYRTALGKHLLWSDNAKSWGYFNPERSKKTMALFDGMEKLTADDAFANANIRILRLAADAAVLDRFPELRQAYPEFKGKAAEFFARIERNHKFVNVRERNLLTAKSWLARAKGPLDLAEIDPKPLPEEFAKITDRRVERHYPAGLNSYLGSFKTNMTDAAWGSAFARPIKDTDTSVEIGFYDGMTPKSYHVHIKDERFQKKGGGFTTVEAIKNGKFNFYKIGTFALKDQCNIWAHGSWAITSTLGGYFDVDHPDRNWDVYLSIKLIGPAYGTADAQNMLFVDQVLMVEKK